MDGKEAAMKGWYVLAGIGALGASLYLLTGCASVNVTHVDDKGSCDGIHFYEPRPYLLVTGSGQSLTNTVIWLPDHSQRYRVKFKGGWGTMKGNIKLVNGWMLDSLGVETDSKIPETITAVGSLVSAAVSAVKTPGTTTAAGPALTNGLYIIDIDGTGKITFERTGIVK